MKPSDILTLAILLGLTWLILWMFSINTPGVDSLSPGNVLKMIGR